MTQHPKDLEQVLYQLPMRIKRHKKLINDAHFYLTKLVGHTPAYRAYYEGETGEGVLEEYSFESEYPYLACLQLWIALKRDNHI